MHGSQDLPPFRLRNSTPAQTTAQRDFKRDQVGFGSNPAPSFSARMSPSAECGRRHVRRRAAQEAKKTTRPAKGATPAAPLRRLRALGCCFWSTVTCRTGAPARGRSSTAPLRCLSGSAHLRLRDPHGERLESIAAYVTAVINIKRALLRCGHSR